MKILLTGLISSSLLICTPAFANADLLKEKMCFQCHNVSPDKTGKSLQRIGPSFQEVSARWKDNKDAEGTLVATIRKGSIEGGGIHWPMNAVMPNDSERPLVSDAEAKQILKWIMSQ